MGMDWIDGDGDGVWGRTLSELEGALVGWVMVVVGGGGRGRG